jgi:hypothetical protein
VICLSDDDENYSSTGKEKCSNVINTSQNDALAANQTAHESDACDAPNWIIDEKDTIRIPELPSKYSDLFKKPFEVRCSSIRFGVVEFDVESEVLLMKETEFEMGLKGMHVIKRATRTFMCRCIQVVSQKTSI